MARNKRFFLVGMAILMLAMASMACGGDSKSNAPTDTPVETGVELVDDAVGAGTDNVVEAESKPECVLDGLFGLKAIKDPEVRLTGLANCVPTTGDAEEYAELVEETARQIEEEAEEVSSE